MRIKQTCPIMELDFDTFQPCFDEIEFYQDNINTSSVGCVSEDVWKKFELGSLLPTPPRSPQHPGAGDNTPSVQDNLQLVSQRLDDGPATKTVIFPDSCELCGNWQSKIIQDCMWSGPGLAAAGLTTDSNHHKVSNKKPESKPPASSDNVVTTTCPTSSVDINTSDCVSPSQVFPYRLSIATPEPILETPSESSDSSDSEEEIDVVTVADKISNVTSANARRKLVTPATVSMSAQVAAMHNYSNITVVGLSHSAPQSPSHTPSPATKRGRVSHSSPTSPQPASKRPRLAVNPSDLRFRLKINRTQRHFARQSSDSEDGDTNKRAQHNVLERQRRNDLKSSFFSLRDHVPELHNQERAPKVQILRKASEFMQQLRIKEKSLTAELERHQKLNQQLKLKLRHMQRGW